VADKERTERLAQVKVEFQKLLEFHAQSFVEIDGKAKYWLTLTLPSFVALMGYLLKEGSSMPLEQLTPGCALLGCLFISTILFSNVLVSRQVESGILAPRSRDIEDVNWYINDKDHWAELSEDQAAEMLRSIKNNETQNSLKSAELRRAEISLLRGAPTAICLAAGAAFLYAAACPSGLAASATGVCASGMATWAAAGAGIATAILTTAALILAHHSFTKS
jgi:hypothetical protein